MANSGAKFVSVNLNKSYGQQHQPSYNTHHSAFGSSGSSYGQAAASGRGRTGGGMVVLSRNRGPQKTAPKLSVPPPLNLPSLRKEHERFDLSGSGGGQAGGAGVGGGQRPSSSGIGWTKPVVSSAMAEKNETSLDSQVTYGADGADVGNRGSSSYMPPSARSNGIGVMDSGSASRSYSPSVEKAMVLRGEDFPSLQAARPSSSGNTQKQKENLPQKQRQVVGEESLEKRDSYNLTPVVDMRSQGQSSRSSHGNGLLDNGHESRSMMNSRYIDQASKQEEYFPGPLPLVRLNPRSDWADDERDTGHGFPERGRDVGYSKNENYWDNDYDLPRVSVLPHKPPQNQYDRWGQRDNETGKGFSNEVLKVDPYCRDVRAPSREGRGGNTWRTLQLPKDGYKSQEAGNDRNVITGRTAGLNNFGKDNKYMSPHFGDTARSGSLATNQDSAFGRKEMGHVPEGRQQWNHQMASHGNRGAENNSRDRYATDQQIRYRGDNFMNNFVSKYSSASGGRSPHAIDPILTLGREKRVFSKGDRPFLEDQFSKDFSSAGFDEDLFSGGLVGVIKRKKEAAKQTDFHDPVRESFEAELERVQRMQELERQRIIEEQERALEEARREEEERQRRIREEEERQRKLEKEAQEAAWRAEQERLEGIRRAEEQRIAREEEKRRIAMEEERRKQAAKQKLLELEARMAKQQAVTVKGDNSVSSAIMDEKLEANLKEKGTSATTDLEHWEDTERGVEKSTLSTSFDPIYNGPFETSYRPYPPREGSSSFVDRGKPINSWRREVFENQNTSPSPQHDQEFYHYSPRREAFDGGRHLPRKDFNGYMPSRAFSKAGMLEPYSDDFGNQKEHYRWGLPGDVDLYSKSREMDSEFHDNFADKYGDIGWGQARPRGNTRSPYPERLHPNSEADDLYAYGRSRYSMRQPRVLPPPLAPMQRASLRGMNEPPGPSAYPDNTNNYNYSARKESSTQRGYYSNHQEGLETSKAVERQPENTANEDQKSSKEDVTRRCDSQSSLSVSSPPNTPPHLSQDELDESGDSPVISMAVEGQKNLLSGNDSVLLNDNSGKDTGEDEEWTLENGDELQQQEEYDEDEDGYQEEDEMREGDDENLELNEKFDNLHLEEKEASDIMDNVVLGFDEGVEVVIPDDDFDGNSRSEERVFTVADSSIDLVEEQGPAVGAQSDAKSFQPAGVSSGTGEDNSSGKTQENEKMLQGFHVQPISAPRMSTASDLSDGADVSGSSGLALQQNISSSGDVTSNAGQSNVSSLASSGTQGDLPVKLQFGLFSGPSLIPSPVPAIQIGSIQMPIHLHPSLGPSLSHIHSSQPPIFQFGQLRYTSPISQGIMPIAPQSLSFVQSNMQTHYNLSPNAGGSVPTQAAQNTSTKSVAKEDEPSFLGNKQSGFVSRPLEQSQGNLLREINTGLVADSAGQNSVVQMSLPGVSGASDNKISLGSDSQAEGKGQIDKVSKNYSSSPKEKGSESQLQHIPPSNNASEKKFSGARAQGQLSGNRGRRFAYAVKNSRSSFTAPDTSLADASGFQRRPRRTVQRTEFRVRESGEKRQGATANSLSNTIQDDKTPYNGRASGIFARSGSKRGTLSSKIYKQKVESESSMSGRGNAQEINSADRLPKEMGKDASMNNQNGSKLGDLNLKRNISEEDVDAPLQSGVVRVFKQPGIEAPSDEDDFIEVRSKRQMLNDRREQREKEIKAKSQVTKPPRKPRASRQNTVASTTQSKVLSSSGELSSNSRTDFAASSIRQTGNKEVSTGFNTLVSQSLAPIGTPAVSEAQTETRSIKSLQTGTLSVVSSRGKDIEQGPVFVPKSKAMDSVPSLNSWGTAGVNQQVMALTQTQLEDAMKPARYDPHISSLGGHSNSVDDPILPSPSMLTKDKSFSSGSSPINSLLAGEKIQFGAVTSPTVLPPSSRVVSHVIGSRGSNRSEMQISHSLSTAENETSLFFEKGKDPGESCGPLQDCEAEAEAAASAVAVAAITSDEIVGNGIGSVSASDTKSFSGTGIGGIPAGVTADHQLESQSRGEESLSVSLPADLSVETTPLSLWPPLPSPQSSSSQMLSHFPGGPPSHFPFYDMNPVLGGPIFAFGPHEESSGTQSQPPKSAATTTGPLGTWQQCHSNVDSFYGPSTGFTGPFISPPGGIPGVQGPPHMVVYNHFAPVGQYGPVGLSFMGTTYIPSGKQPDWKHNPTSSAMHIGEGDMNNMNITSAPRNAPNIATSIQHLAPGSPLLPMGSPMPMFDVSPFQSAADVSVQARWSHVPASPLHSVPLSRPLQQQAEGLLPCQVSHAQSLNTNRLSESRVSTPSEGGQSFPVASDTNVTQFSAELGLVDSSKSTNNTGASARTGVNETVSGSLSAESVKTGGQENNVNHNGKNQHASSMRSQSFVQKNASSGGYASQRGVGMSQRSAVGNEWSHRRMGFHGRNQSLGTDKVFPPSKVKQIYVAKQTCSSGTSGAA